MNEYDSARMAVHGILVECGYSVLVAATPGEAGSVRRPSTTETNASSFVVVMTWWTPVTGGKYVSTCRPDPSS
jgi:hypothetical protein